MPRLSGARKGGPARAAAVGGLAVALVAFGLFQIVALLRAGPAANPLPSATLNGLTASVQHASWVGMDMSGFMPGYQMPASMMPGMPEDGYHRFAVTVTIVNTGGGTRQFHADRDFSLRTAGDEKSWPAEATTFGPLPRLGADNGITGDIYFDLPESVLADFSAWIEWQNQDGRTALQIPLVGGEPSHGH